MTPRRAFGSIFLIGMVSTACGGPSATAEADPAPARAAPTSPPAPRATPERCLGIADRGIWSDLDDQIQLALPAALAPSRVAARLDTRHALLVVSIDGFP